MLSSIGRPSALLRLSLWRKVTSDNSFGSEPNPPTATQTIVYQKEDERAPDRERLWLKPRPRLGCLATLVCITDLTPRTHKKGEKKMFGRTKQIVEDRAEPQQIVATRLLYCLQHPLPIQVVCKRFFPAHIVIAIHELDSRPFRPLPVTRQLWYTSIRDALFLLISYKRDQHHRFQHRFWLRGVQPLSSVW